MFSFVSRITTSDHSIFKTPTERMARWYRPVARTITDQWKRRQLFRCVVGSDHDSRTPARHAIRNHTRTSGENRAAGSSMATWNDLVDTKDVTTRGQPGGATPSPRLDAQEPRGR